MDNFFFINKGVLEICSKKDVDFLFWVVEKREGWHAIIKSFPSPISFYRGLHPWKQTAGMLEKTHQLRKFFTKLHATLPKRKVGHKETLGTGFLLQTSVRFFVEPTQWPYGESLLLAHRHCCALGACSTLPLSHIEPWYHETKRIYYTTYPNGWFCLTNVSINIKRSTSMDALGIRSRVKYKTSPPQMFHAIFWESFPLTKFTHDMLTSHITSRHRTRHTANSKAQLIPLAQLFHKLCLPQPFSWDFKCFPKQTRDQKSVWKKWEFRM